MREQYKELAFSESRGDAAQSRLLMGAQWATQHEHNGVLNGGTEPPFTFNPTLQTPLSPEQKKQAFRHALAPSPPPKEVRTITCKHALWLKSNAYSDSIRRIFFIESNPFAIHFHFRRHCLTSPSI